MTDGQMMKQILKEIGYFIGASQVLPPSYASLESVNLVDGEALKQPPSKACAFPEALLLVVREDQPMGLDLNLLVSLVL